MDPSAAIPFAQFHAPQPSQTFAPRCVLFPSTVNDSWQVLPMMTRDITFPYCIGEHVLETFPWFTLLSGPIS